MVTTLHTRLDLVRDYVNTFDLETGIDTIATPDELATWLSEQGLVDDLVEPTGQEVEDARAVREAIRELLLANNGVEADAGAASKTLEEAGRDLYADEWQLFRRITLPLLMPAIGAGAIMAFVVSLDDFLISMMVSSAGSTTLPVYVYGMMRLGVTPEVNAISTILLVVSLIFVTAALLLGRRYQRMA